jgi:hypothetical protein
MTTRSRRNSTSSEPETSPPVVSAKWLAFHHIGSVITVRGRDITLSRRVSGPAEFYSGVLTSLRMNKNEIVLILQISQPRGTLNESRVIQAELS